MNREQVFRVSNEKTMGAFNEIWQSNATQNALLFRRHGRIQDALTGTNKVALVCGSGSSLDLHVDLIHRYREKLCLLAADMAYPALMQHGIDPDYVVNMDPMESLKSCFDHMSANPRSALIAATVSHPAVLQNWKGKIYFYNLFDPQSQVLKRISRTFPGIRNVESKFNVGEFALSLACSHFHFQHVGFAGIDLAYYKNLYCATGAGASFPPGSDELICLWNNDNQPTFTTGRFVLYMRAFMENYLKIYRPASTIYNLSKGIIPLHYQLTEFEQLLQ